VLEHFDWKIGQFAPKVVFIMLGMNDCSTDRDISPAQFAENLQRIVDRVRETPDSIPVLQTTCEVIAPMAGSRGENLPVYMDVVRSVAARNDLPVIDHYKYWQERLAVTPHVLNYWLSDPFHPNSWGHQVFAELIYKELGIFDEKAVSGRLFHP
jgi:lysophospholipase L1-like esterase